MKTLTFITTSNFTEKVIVTVLLNGERVYRKQYNNIDRALDFVSIAKRVANEFSTNIGINDYIIYKFCDGTYQIDNYSDYITGDEFDAEQLYNIGRGL